MSRLLLDTTFLVGAERRSSDLHGAIADEDDVALAAVTIAELRVGVLLADRRRRAIRTTYVEEVMATIPVIDYDRKVAEAHAGLLVEVRAQGRPRGAHDLIIASTAKAFGRIVLTADASGFADLTGVEVRAHR